MEKFKVLLKTRLKKCRRVKLDHADSLLDKSIEMNGIMSVQTNHSSNVSFRVPRLKNGDSKI